MSDNDLIFRFVDDQAVKAFKKDDKFHQFVNRMDWLYDIRDEVAIFKKDHPELSDDPLEDKAYFEKYVYKDLPDVEKRLFRTYIIKDLSPEKAQGLFEEMERLREKGEMIKYVHFSIDYQLPLTGPQRQPGFADHVNWGIGHIGSGLVWSRTRGEGVIVAVIDSGVDYCHDFIKRRMWTHPDSGIFGRDFFNDTDDPRDFRGHGTRCAGIIAAEKSDYVNLSVAPCARIMALKITPERGTPLADPGKTKTQPCVQAIKYAVNHGAQILSNCWEAVGLSASDPSLTCILDFAYFKGRTVIFSAGNQGVNVQGHFPAEYEKVISVGGTDLGNSRALDSNWGTKVTVAAPGHRIKSLVLGSVNGTDDDSGTSMACPHVAGLAALMLKLDSKLPPDRIKDLIRLNGKKFTVDKKPPNKWSRIDVVKTIANIP